MGNIVESVFLTDAEIFKATGRRYPKAQLKHLKRLGIPAKADADGRPLVLRAVFESIMGASNSTRRPVEPDWETMRNGAPSAKH